MKPWVLELYVDPIVHNGTYILHQLPYVFEDKEYM